MTSPEDVPRRVERMLRGYRRWPYWAPLPLLGISWLELGLRLPMRRFGAHLVVQLVMTVLIVVVASGLAARVARRREEEARLLGAVEFCRVEFCRVELSRQLRGSRWMPWLFCAGGAASAALAFLTPARESVWQALLVAPLAIGVGLYWRLVRFPRLRREQRELAGQRG